jgi:hypothetical protein
MLDNVGRLLRAVGLDYRIVGRPSTSGFGEFAARTRSIAYFCRPPTRATAGVTALAADFRVEIEVVAAASRSPPARRWPPWDGRV